jgi:FKBP-type peptidyl-prolyl cis-trans isomerase
LYLAHKFNGYYQIAAKNSHLTKLGIQRLHKAIKINKNSYMKNVFKVVLLFVLMATVVSCNKNDDDEQTPIRDYAAQYATDLAAIQTYLKTHKLPTTFNPNTMQHVTFEVVPELDPTSFWGSNATTPNANVKQLQVEKDNITYTLYYLELQQGTAATSKTPCNLDGVLTSYEGQLLDGTVFDSNFYPQTYFNLNGVIRGWSEVFPKFSSGSYISNPDGSVAYSNFGAGIMFLPSGLAYYANPTTNIPSYSPLIFSFKLYEVQRLDNDGDGIPSYLEDRGGPNGSTIPDGYIRDNETTYEDDTDHDGVPDAFDLDDDEDGFLTKEETKYTLLGGTYYYPYNGAAVNDPLTDIDDTQGIPSCGATPDYTTPTRLRKHLDPSCH